MKKAIIIPARYASKRFPGKILAQINGMPMIQHVYLQCQKSSADTIIIATDDVRIKNTCTAFGADARITDKAHNSGTERCIEIAKTLIDYDTIMNVQGDEPLIDPKAIDQLFEFHVSSKAKIATLLTPIYDIVEISNPNIVKCVFSNSGRALYFSRAAIPFERDRRQTTAPCEKHVGIYVFSKKTLLSLEYIAKSKLENIEKLEQLRWLENDYPIHVLSTEYNNIGVDTKEDLEKVARLLLG